jgi:hypothetical protein
MFDIVICPFHVLLPLSPDELLPCFEDPFKQVPRKAAGNLRCAGAFFFGG